MCNSCNTQQNTWIVSDPKFSKIVPDHYKGLDPRAHLVDLGLNPGQASAFDLRENWVKTLYNGAIHNWDISLPWQEKDSTQFQGKTVEQNVAAYNFTPSLRRAKRLNPLIFKFKGTHILLEICYVWIILAPSVEIGKLGSITANGTGINIHTDYGVCSTAFAKNGVLLATMLGMAVHIHPALPYSYKYME